MNNFEAIKYWGRVKTGALIHWLGWYAWLLPIYRPKPNEFIRRLQSYLNHYYEQVEHAEANLFLTRLGLKFACDIKDHMLWDFLQGQATIYEQKEIEHCRVLVNPGDHILDIGANHGFWGFTLANQKCRNTILYLGEANPMIVTRLQKTIRMNLQIAAQVLPFAVGDGSTAQLRFYVPKGNLSGLGSTVLHNHAADRGWLNADHYITVAAKSIDMLVDEGIIEGIDLLKIDVEHGEDAVIRGGLIALKRFRPRLVMIETSVNSWAAKTLGDLGYITYCLDENGSRKPVDNGFWGNIFFVLNPST